MSSLEELEEGGEGEESEGDEDDVEEQVDQFFAELDIDQERQRRRLKSEGIRVRTFTVNNMADVIW